MVRLLVTLLNDVTAAKGSLFPQVATVVASPPACSLAHGHFLAPAPPQFQEFVFYIVKVYTSDILSGHLTVLTTIVRPPFRARVPRSWPVVWNAFPTPELFSSTPRPPGLCYQESFQERLNCSHHRARPLGLVPDVGVARLYNWLIYAQ
jgi:hypothetical protein